MSVAPPRSGHRLLFAGCGSYDRAAHGLSRLPISPPTGKHPMASALFSPIRLADLELDNRIVVSPMCQYSADDGVANDWHSRHLGMLANSGAGLVIVEATHVERHGRITHGCLGLYSDHCEAALARVIDHCRRIGTAKLGIQLAHAGRKASAQRPWEGGGALQPAPGPVGDDRAVGDPVRPGLAHAARRDRGRHRARARGLRRRRRSARCASASTRSSCTARTAIWRTASCRRSRTSAPTSTAARSRTACAFRSRSRGRCAPWCRSGIAARRPHHRQRLARRRAHAGRCGRVSPRR